VSFRRDLTNKEVRELLKPCLRLFMSVDVVDSTPFKQRREGHEGLEWLAPISYFLALFPKELVSAYRKSDREKATLWKSVGDELVFVALLKSEQDAIAHVRALKTAMENFATHKFGKDLRLKATAWTAGFPVGNVALPMRKPEHEVPYEFLGPSIDSGFRLAGLSTPRRMTISLELAWILRRAKADFPMFYSGRQKLKGILESEGCPHVWIDIKEPRPDSMTWHEEKLLDHAAAGKAKLEAFCRAYILESGVPGFLPFIKNCPQLGPDRTSSAAFKKSLTQRKRVLQLLLQGVDATMKKKAPRERNTNVREIWRKLNEELRPQPKR
jgi:hypothetical protein